MASWREAGLLFLVGPFETLLSIYNAIVQPHFDYCSVVWGNCNKSLSIKLQKLQNRFAHILTSSYDANADNLFVTLGWQKHNLQRELKTATMVYKSLNGLAPDYLKSMFTDRSAISTYSLSNCEGKLAVPLPRTNFLKNSLSIVVWCCGTAYVPICSKHKLLLVLNPAADVSFFIINKLINHMAFMESRHFVTVFYFCCY